MLNDDNVPSLQLESQINKSCRAQKVHQLSLVVYIQGSDSGQ